MTYLELLDGDFPTGSPEREGQERLAKWLAEAAGWRDAGLFYKHPTRLSYLKSDMDGWSDLCSNEGIVP